MIDAVQLVLLIVITVLTVLLVILGIQVFFILREFRVTLRKTNRVLDNTEAITSNIEQPLNFVNSFFNGTQTLSQIAKFLTSRRRESNRDYRE
jgi:hypothetical protein